MWVVLNWLSEALDWYIDCAAAGGPEDVEVLVVQSLTLHATRSSTGLWSASIAEAPWCGSASCPTAWLAIGEAVSQL